MHSVFVQQKTNLRSWKHNAFPLMTPSFVGIESRSGPGIERCVPTLANFSQQGRNVALENRVISICFVENEKFMFLARGSKTVVLKKGKHFRPQIITKKLRL